MEQQPYTLLEPVSAPTPLVLDSPHSGRRYPDDFIYACPLPLLRQTEDSYVDELIAGATHIGAAVLVAEFPRCYIDANRAEDDIDPALLGDVWPSTLRPSERTLLGLGLVRRLCRSGVPVYKAPLPAAEVHHRIARYYRPYHAALDAVLDNRLKAFGACYLVNCHSMPDAGAESRASRRPDFVLGDRSGTSCDISFTRLACNLLQDMGYSVALNDPYKGVEIVRRHGQPQRGRHALQLEINRRLYMNELTLEKTANFARLQHDLKAFFEALTQDIVGGMAQPLAAE